MNVLLTEHTYPHGTPYSQATLESGMLVGRFNHKVEVGRAFRADGSMRSDRIAGYDAWLEAVSLHATLTTH